MNDEELLEKAAASYQSAADNTNEMASQACSLESIAASLLVIARNSVSQERTEIEVQPLELNSVRHLKDKPSPHNNS